MRSVKQAMKLRLRSLLFFCSIAALSAPLRVAAQEEISWKMLASITFNRIYDKEMGYHVSYPVFPQELKALQGKSVSIKGYIVPIEENTGYFALSAFPYQNCFFCGNAGIESVIEIYANKPIAYTTKPVKVTGKLELNDKDLLEHLIYILRDVKVVAE